MDGCSVGLEVKKETWMRWDKDQKEGGVGRSGLSLDELLLLSNDALGET